MTEIRLGVVESRFADLVWAAAPLTTRALVELCEKELTWKRTTTYTVLKKCCEKGLFDICDRTVTVKMSREDFYANQSTAFVERAFDGSLPAFLAAFASCRKPTKEELAEIRDMIDSFEGTDK